MRWLRPLGIAAALMALGCNGKQPDKDASSSTAAPSTTAAGSTTAASATASASPAEEKRPLNVILLTIDSLRADMPWQGFDKDIAPRLTALAKKSVVYPNAYSISSYTAKSVGGLLSGRYPSTLHRGNTFFTHYSKANVFFPELLQEKGVRTMAGHAHLYFERSINLKQGFDVWRLVPGLTWNSETDESITSPKTTDLAMEMLGDANNVKGHFFVWLHYMDPHDKYLQHEEAPRFGRKARDLYHNEVYYTDLHIGKLLDWCEKQPWWKDTVVIVSSDHGEAFGEHDQWKHAFALWEVLTRVPLFVHGPGMKARTILMRRSHIDLAPTIMELLGQPPHEGFVGKSMVPELYGAEPEDREPILLDLPADRHNPPARTVTKGNFKLLEDPGPKYKLFDLKADPGELNNVADNPPNAEDFKRMKKVFDDAWGKHPYAAPFGGGEIKGGGRANGVDPDPPAPK
jgi:arylsulfatase A-like enzyme